MVLHRDEATNEVVKTLVDKKKRVRVSKLRKAIVLKREKEKKLKQKRRGSKVSEDFETIYESENEEG